MLDGTWGAVGSPCSSLSEWSGKGLLEEGNVTSEAVKSWHVSWCLGLACNLSLKAKDSKVSPNFSDHFEA